MAKDIESIIKRAQQLGQKTAPRSISPKEVGDLHVDTLEVIEETKEELAPEWASERDIINLFNKQ